MKLNDKEKKAINTLNKILKSENIIEILGHFVFGKTMMAIDDIIKKLPLELKDEINKKLNK